jgi:transposase
MLALVGSEAPFDHGRQQMELKLGTARSSRAQKLAAIADGAEWFWNLVDRHFPGAIQIVDLFHARLETAYFERGQAEACPTP